MENFKILCYKMREGVFQLDHEALLKVMRNQIDDHLFGNIERLPNIEFRQSAATRIVYTVYFNHANLLNRVN